MTLIFDNVANGKYIVRKGHSVLGYAEPADDGYLYFWPMQRSGFWPSGTMRAIADKLDELNKPWDEIVAREIGPK